MKKEIIRLIICVLIALWLCLLFPYKAITVNAQDMWEGYWLEMQYLNQLYTVDQICKTNDHRECNKQVAILTWLAFEIAEYRCQFYSWIKRQICLQNSYIR